MGWRGIGWGAGTDRLGVGLEEEGRVVKPVFAFGVVGHGGRWGVRLALGGWCWLTVDLDGGRFVARVSGPAVVVGGGGRRAAGDARDQLARSSVVEVTSMVMVGCGDGVLGAGCGEFWGGVGCGAHLSLAGGQAAHAGVGQWKGVFTVASASEFTA